jgi:hypothetical protein
MQKCGEAAVTTAGTRKTSQMLLEQQTKDENHDSDLSRFDWQLLKEHEICEQGGASFGLGAC